MKIERVRAGMDVWKDLELAKGAGRRFVVLPVTLAERIYTAANWPHTEFVGPKDIIEVDLKGKEDV